MGIKETLKSKHETFKNTLLTKMAKAQAQEPAWKIREKMANNARWEEFMYLCSLEVGIFSGTLEQLNQGDQQYEMMMGGMSRAWPIQELKNVNEIKKERIRGRSWRKLPDYYSSLRGDAFYYHADMIVEYQAEGAFPNVQESGKFVRLINPPSERKEPRMRPI